MGMREQKVAIAPQCQAMQYLLLVFLYNMYSRETQMPFIRRWLLHTNLYHKLSTNEKNCP